MRVLSRRLRRAAALALALVGGACGGASNDVIVPGDDLLEPGSTARRDAGTSSSASSSGTPSGSSSTGGNGSSSINSSGAPAIDASVPGCDPSWALTAPVAVPGLPAHALSPSFTANELSVYFLQAVGDQNRVYAATRPSLQDPFGAPLELGPNVNGGASKNHVFLSDDSLSLYFSHSSNVYIVTRASSAESFGPTSLVRDNASNEIVARDGSARFFARQSDGIRPFALRPADAGADVAERLGVVGWPTWYEPASGVLWVDTYYLSGYQILFKSIAIRWNGAAWGGATDADLAVHWISRDGCRLYGTTAAAVVMRSRVLPP